MLAQYEENYYAQEVYQWVEMFLSVRTYTADEDHSGHPNFTNDRQC